MDQLDRKCEKMYSNDAEIFGFVEPNVNWTEEYINTAKVKEANIYKQMIL